MLYYLYKLKGANMIISIGELQKNISILKKAKELFYRVAKREVKVIISEGIIMECLEVLIKTLKSVWSNKGLRVLRKSICQPRVR